MKNCILGILLFSISGLSHAGFIVTEDSSEHGVLKVSRDIKTNTVRIEECKSLLGQECALIDTKSAFSINLSQAFNHLQTASAAVLNIAPAVVGAGIALSPVGWAGAGAIAFEGIGGSIVTAAGTKLITIPKSLNVIRMYDFSKVYMDSFLEDDTSVIALPDDTMADVVNELL